MAETVGWSEGLSDDWEYVRMMARRSEFPFKYVTRYQALGTCPVSNCNKQFHSGPAQVDTLNTLVDAIPTRVEEHGNRPNTQLFGTAPFKARGDGQLQQPDVSNKLMRQPVYWKECTRPLSEIPYNRYDYVAFPNRTEWWHRGGESTRVGPQYTQIVPM